jgi:hypothetical protein
MFLAPSARAAGVPNHRHRFLRQKVLVTTSDVMESLNLTLLDKYMPMAAVQQQRGSFVEAWTLRTSTSS